MTEEPVRIERTATSPSSSWTHGARADDVAVPAVSRALFGTADLRGALASL